MPRGRLQVGASGSFSYPKPAETQFAWRYGYYTDSGRPDDDNVTEVPDAHWGNREEALLRESFVAEGPEPDEADSSKS